jgi:AcrR family transcriptional regulator
MLSKDKKKEIVQKTAELLSSGDGEITTRKIADNAGINPAMVNYYFGSKDDLLKAAVAVMSGDRSVEMPHEQEASRKAMFDILVRKCDATINYSKYGLNKDAASFSNDALALSSKLFEIKKAIGGKASDEDASLIFKTVCFLMAASSDPNGFMGYSGIDVRVKGQLRLLVSKQLDILLGDAL